MGCAQKANLGVKETTKKQTESPYVFAISLIHNLDLPKVRIHWYRAPDTASMARVPPMTLSAWLGPVKGVLAP